MVIIAKKGVLRSGRSCGFYILLLVLFIHTPVYPKLKRCVIRQLHDFSVNYLGIMHHASLSNRYVNDTSVIYSKLVYIYAPNNRPDSVLNYVRISPDSNHYALKSIVTFALNSVTGRIQTETLYNKDTAGWQRAEVYNYLYTGTRLTQVLYVLDADSTRIEFEYDGDNIKNEILYYRDSVNPWQKVLKREHCRNSLKKDSLCRYYEWEDPEWVESFVLKDWFTYDGQGRLHRFFTLDWIGYHREDFFYAPTGIDSRHAPTNAPGGFSISCVRVHGDGSSTLYFRLHKPAAVSIALFKSNGACIGTVHDDWFYPVAGDYSVSCRPLPCSGVYVYRCTAGDMVLGKSFLFVK